MAAATFSSTMPVNTPVPAMEPPPGVQSNFIDPPSLAVYSTITISVCTSLVTILYGLRCFVRIFYKKIWNLEDWFITLAWVGTVSFMAILAELIQSGGGRHNWDITLGQARWVAYWFNIVACEYAATILMTKLSILWLYRRAFSPRKGSAFEITVFILIAIHVGYYGATLLAKIWECTPRSKIVDPTVPGHCISIYAVLISDGIFNMVTDFFILLMPATTIYKLKMDGRKKLFILMIFTFGLCAPIFSVIGFYVRLKHGGDADTSWNQPQIVFWGAAEVAVGTMCVCIPELGVLFNRKSRPSSRPTASILYGKAKGALSGRSAEPSLVGRTAIDPELASVNPYVELHEAHTTVKPVDQWTLEQIPENSVRVQHDFRIVTQ